MPGLPRTNNELEHEFGAARYHERRASGRQGASPGLVVRGAVRVVAAVATCCQPLGGVAPRPADLAAWWRLRRQIQARQAARGAQRRFRRDPDASLAALEEPPAQRTLPA